MTTPKNVNDLVEGLPTNRAYYKVLNQSSNGIWHQVWGNVGGRVNDQIQTLSHYIQESIRK